MEKAHGICWRKVTGILRERMVEQLEKAHGAKWKKVTGTSWRKDGGTVGESSWGQLEKAHRKLLEKGYTVTGQLGKCNLDKSDKGQRNRCRRFIGGGWRKFIQPLRER